MWISESLPAALREGELDVPVAELETTRLFTALVVAVIPKSVLAFVSLMLVTIFGLVSVIVVPSLVALVIPPNALELLYCTCVLLPPGAPPPPAGTAHVASSRRNLVVPATFPGVGTSPWAPAPPLSPTMSVVSQ